MCFFLRVRCGHGEFVCLLCGQDMTNTSVCLWSVCCGGVIIDELPVEETRSKAGPSKSGK